MSACIIIVRPFAVLMMEVLMSPVSHWRRFCHSSGLYFAAANSPCAAERDDMDTTRSMRSPRFMSMYMHIGPSACVGYVLP